MQSVSYCLCPGTKLITNKTLHQSTLMTGMCAAPCNDEYNKNKKGIQTAALGLFSSKVDIDGRLAKYFPMSTSGIQNYI